jgi:hypothetical protein
MARPHDRRCPHLGSPHFERKPVLSSSYRNRLARPLEEEEPPPPPPDYIVTGTLTPDSTGDYFEAGIHNGKPYYEREDSTWFLWYRYISMVEVHLWYISLTLGDPAGTLWMKQTDTFEPPPGSYSPENEATGTATVAEP